MAGGTHEQTINTALAEVLQTLGRTWTLRAENVGRIFEDGGRPDILLEKPEGWPIVIEAEVDNHRQAEVEASSRLNKRLISNEQPIHAAVALVYPSHLRNFDGHLLRDELRRVEFEYLLLTVDNAGTSSRLPASGWLKGRVEDLATLLHRSSIPAWRVEALADALELGVMRAEGGFTASHPHGSALGAEIAALLGQVDDPSGQTRRMAMTVIVDAFVFHAALSEAELMVSDADGQRTVRSPTASRVNGTFLPTHLIDEWERILGVNYWPIFHTASDIVRRLPARSASRVLAVLWETAEQLVVGGVTRSHDLTGVVFQRLIADRKFLATYYTMPSGAALLAGLALPMDRPITGTDWGDAGQLGDVRIGDFACGTGTLLSTAYQRLGLLHELKGGDARSLHPRLMERGLVGLDVLTVAVHLTAAMLAGSYPETPFGGECLLTMPYGAHAWGVSLGSLDLLDVQPSFDVMQAAAQTAGGRGAEEVHDLLGRVGHGQFDLVIMNPPFTRHGAREGDRSSVHNPAFAAFGSSEQEQNALARHLHRLGSGGSAHGHAGLASYFVDLGHRKVREGGTLALVLPMSALSGASWEGVRSLWRREYSEIVVATVAGSGSFERAFSADTGMAECLFLGIRRRPAGDEPRATFVMLDAQPASTLEGELIAGEIRRAIQEGVRRLEDGPFGGTRLCLGQTLVGYATDCPLPTAGAWQMSGIKDVSLGQTAHQLAAKRTLWIEGMSRADAPEIPITRMGDVIARVGPHHLDITGAQTKSDGMPQGPFERHDGVPRGAAYPALWAHDNLKERRLVVEPDSHLQLRTIRGSVPEALAERAQLRWSTATRAHYNVDFQFNSQSLALAMTPTPSVGGRAWPSVVLSDPEHEYALALWCNSTLGLMCHWWMSNKTQAGRGSTTVTGIPSIPTLNLVALSAEQHQRAKEAFDALSTCRFLPFDQIDEDEARAELDRRLLVDVLGLDAGLLAAGGPMERLRHKLSAEPQIHSDKRSRVVFTEAGESTQSGVV